MSEMKLRDIISPFYAWKRALEKPFTIDKPVKDRPGAPRYRGFHLNDIEKCIGCGTCEAICQNEAIDMVRVEGIESEPGDSGLRPRIDYGRCCWCALCIDVCPTNCLGMSNEYNWISSDADSFRYTPGIDRKHWDSDELGYRRAEGAWLLEPQAADMPVIDPERRKGTFDEMAHGYNDELAREESTRCTECGLCIEACPTHMDVPQYIRAIRENDLDEALRILYDSNPFSESCGRVCTAHCQDVCSLKHRGEPIMIRWLKRFITDRTADRRNEILGIGKGAPETGRKVAIVGGGPSGLTAAFYLRSYGHQVTLYEMHEKLGGMLLWGIPDYRLPEEILQREIQTILDTGVDVKLNTRVGGEITLDDLRKVHDALYISIGAQKGSGMPIEGQDSPGVLVGVEFLELINEGERPDLGGRVAVVGGGNTAMDVCRSAVRLGAGEVQVLYRRTEKEMPAAHEEIEEAREEGVIFEFLVAPERIRSGKEGLEIVCIRMELGEPDDSGRRRPVPIEGSEFTMTVDTCIMAIGQYVDGGIAEEAGMKVTRWQTIEVHEDDLSTNIEGIFAGGDCMTGPDDAIRAIADGKKAAYAIHEYLSKGVFMMNDEKMLKFESVEAAIEFAIGKEQEAYDFYTDWSKKLEHEAIQQVFREFAVEELRHRDLLSDVRDGKREIKTTQNVQDLKITDYFTEVKASENLTYQDALQLAIQRERGSIELYGHLAESSEVPELAKIFSSLVEEETKHKMRLEMIYDDNFLKEG